ncbi:glutathione-dependent formaldehyde-activating enzyme [Colletotrichum karsti]|uniref:Glutathione-dependent formaldehyde-activating enzyme n=1 Tax=Colletotrichum karsti TaxID=1095194 RepID=A0A9P6IDU3_9PEZI|nr:glutathione-dependent formaldehyde-activating enzyme [Colletotrichum karsti]KAF9878721.1 glutathione-dependent formaldehyde-activating enzyme [Colletotrichum karsti]
MAGFTGHCNCGGVKVTLKEKPDQVLVCHCANCKRAGGPFSMNFFVEDGEMELEDSQKTLSEYLDHNTDSGNIVHRFFCKNCGSPVKTTSPAVPGKAFLKASLFDDIPTKKHEVYTEKALHF